MKRLVRRTETIERMQTVPSFRYPGPKPQSRETAVLMLADAVESASRTLKEPTPRRIQSLVHEITMKRLLDGQFDECNLKMNEIRMVEESLIKSLLAAHLLARSLSWAEDSLAGHRYVQGNH